MKVFLASGGYLSIDVQCKKALEDLGHEVVIYNYRPNKVSKIPLGIVRQYYGRTLLKKVFEYKPDFFFMIKGETIPKGIVKQFSSKGIVTANWTLDEPLGELYSFNKIHNIEEYDYFFVFDPSYIEKLKKINPNSFYLPCSADPINMHVEAIPMKKRNYLYDISFVGSYQPERKVMVEKISQFEPHIFGFNWKNEDNKIKNLHKQFVGGIEMSKVFNQSKINLNIQTLHGKESMNMRTFEIPATKSFQLVDFKKELPNLFRLDKEVTCYYDLDDLNEKIKYYLEHPEKRDKIAIAGHKRILEEHKTSDRVKTILKTVGLN